MDSVRLSTRTSSKRNFTKKANFLASLCGTSNGMSLKEEEILAKLTKQTLKKVLRANEKTLSKLDPWKNRKKKKLLIMVDFLNMKMITELKKQII